MSLDALGDDDLATRAAAGDAAAFAALIAAQYPRVLRIAWRLMGSRAEAEDLAQEVFLRLGTSIRGFRGEAAFTTWLTRIVLNAGRDQIRARDRARRLCLAYAEAEALSRAGDAARAADHAWLVEGLERLSPDLRETAALVVGEGMSHAAAAETLGVAEATVSWRLAQIRRHLRIAVTEEHS